MLSNKKDRQINTMQNLIDHLTEENAYLKNRLELIDSLNLNGQPAISNDYHNKYETLVHKLNDHQKQYQKINKEMKNIRNNYVKCLKQIK